MLSDDNLHSLTYLQRDAVITIPKPPNEEVFVFLSNILVEKCTRSPWSIDIMSFLCFLNCELTKKMNTNSILIVYLVNLTQ